MKKVQDAKRYEHTLGVAFTAAALAMRYDCDIQDAQTAGLLHDCAKCMSDEKRLAICKKRQIHMTEVEKKSPFLLHAKVGAYLAAEKYGIKNQDILNAIQNHTTGRPGMSSLEKIIFIADYIEPGRSQAPNLAKIRKLAFVNLDQALLAILEDTLSYLKTTGSSLDPMTERTWLYYRDMERCEIKENDRSEVNGQ
ncbi:MAG: HD domain-containing protein [Lachnospiraceae bacterium]|nr:HD domain-containing protein [Lachnospiraceae bacterium]